MTIVESSGVPIKLLSNRSLVPCGVQRWARSGRLSGALMRLRTSSYPRGFSPGCHHGFGGRVHRGAGSIGGFAHSSECGPPWDMIPINFEDRPQWCVTPLVRTWRAVVVVHVVGGVGIRQRGVRLVVRCRQRRVCQVRKVHCHVRASPHQHAARGCERQGFRGWDWVVRLSGCSIKKGWVSVAVSDAVVSRTTMRNRTPEISWFRQKGWATIVPLGLSKTAGVRGSVLFQPIGTPRGEDPSCGGSGRRAESWFAVPSLWQQFSVKKPTTFSRNYSTFSTKSSSHPFRSSSGRVSSGIVNNDRDLSRIFRTKFGKYFSRRGWTRKKEVGFDQFDYADDFCSERAFPRRQLDQTTNRSAQEGEKIENLCLNGSHVIHHWFPDVVSCKNQKVLRTNLSMILVGYPRPRRSGHLKKKSAAIFEKIKTVGPTRIFLLSWKHPSSFFINCSGFGWGWTCRGLSWFGNVELVPLFSEKTHKVNGISGGAERCGIRRRFGDLDQQGEQLRVGFGFLWWWRRGAIFLRFLFHEVSRFGLRWGFRFADDYVVTALDGSMWFPIIMCILCSADHQGHFSWIVTRSRWTQAGLSVQRAEWTARWRRRIADAEKVKIEGLLGRSGPYVFRGHGVRKCPRAQRLRCHRWWSWCWELQGPVWTTYFPVGQGRGGVGCDRRVRVGRWGGLRLPWVFCTVDQRASSMGFCPRGPVQGHRCYGIFSNHSLCHGVSARFVPMRLSMTGFGCNRF